VKWLLDEGLIDRRSVRSLKKGSAFDITITNGERHFDQPIKQTIRFLVNRENLTTMKADGWNGYLFDLPAVGEPLHYEVLKVERVKKK
jgi:hypothetical protein